LEDQAHGIDIALSTAAMEKFAASRMMLNPYFSAWLMGFPPAWLDVILETDFRSRKKYRTGP